MLKIAWRNIMRHRGKSIVIGIILFLGAFIMTVGNGVLSGMDRGLKENIMNRFTGHIVVISKEQEANGVLFTPMGKDIQVITNYNKIKKVLEQQDYIRQFLPLARGLTIILNDEGDMGFCISLGVNFQEYQRMFRDNVKLVEGKFLNKDDKGILVTQGTRKQIFDEQGFWAIPEGAGLNEKNLTPEAAEIRKSLLLKDSLVLMGSSSENTTVDIRLPVKGIIKYEYLDDYWKHFNFVDIESFREAFHYVTASDAAVKIPAEKEKIFEADNLDSLFGESVVKKVETRQEQYKLSGLIGKKVVKKNFDIDSGSYNLVFIKIKDPEKIDECVQKLNASLKKAEAGGRAITWKQATGQLADMATIIRGALFGFVVFIFFVAIIIIMNTLSMAAMERVNEIGMMRAVGAHRSFIGWMFFLETSFLSFLFGGAGIIAGIIAVIILNFFNITTDNHILELLYGGSVFRPFLGFFDIFIGIIELAVVTLIAIIYPLKVARRITPLEAIARD